MTTNTKATEVRPRGAFPFMLPSPLDESVAKAAEEKKTCDKYVLSGLTKDVTVQFLMERLIGMGCTPPSGFISCIDCGDRQAGAGFGVVEETVVPPLISRADRKEADERRKRQCDNKSTMTDLQDQIKAQNEGKSKLRLLPEIFLCQQNIVSEEHARQSMVHELIHAIDLCRTKMDPINNCIHMACTEIRAENLSGECNAVREAINGRIDNFKGHGAECVKRRAALSVKANPNCAEKAHEYVDAAFEKCFRDTFPFDRHPNLR